MNAVFPAIGISACLQDIERERYIIGSNSGEQGMVKLFLMDGANKNAQRDANQKGKQEEPADKTTIFV